MKKLTLFIILFSCSITSALFAQSPKTIEADFDKAFEKLNYARENSMIDTVDYINGQIEKKLMYYTKKYPAAMDIAFKKINGIVSDDGLFRILSWDTMLGGTQHFFENVIQYKSGGKTNSIVDTVKKEDDYIFSYNGIYTLTVGNARYYLATYYGIFGRYERGEGIRVFAIENGKLNDKVKLIKTRSGLTHKLYYIYNQTLTNSDIMSEVTIKYDPKSREIKFPVIIDDGEISKVTETSIAYKFTGQYFEKVKS
ncbi:hypothetical protein [Mucilaginibacter sp. NFX135]|uniref:hypothetical protein n=1 Tax=Mucilaginibacter sp. NFX135 TaxID=3402687 RepID=UPI003AFB05C9